MPNPSLSIVIPVYNEEATLATLFARLYPALDALGESYEIVFVNDGSRDRSAAILRQQFEVRPESQRGQARISEKSALVRRRMRPTNNRTFTGQQETTVF